MKVTATNLEAFRLYRQFDFKSLAELEAQLRSEKIEPTPEMNLGSIYDAMVLCVNFPPVTFDVKVPGDYYESNGLKIDIRSAVPAHLGFESALFQVWANNTGDYLKLGQHSLWLIGKIDVVVGNILYDLKTRDGYFKIENYPDSLQWKFYCYLFGVKSFVYRLAQLKEVNGIWYTEDVQDVPLYYDESCEIELIQWLREFADFVVERNIEIK